MRSFMFGMLIVGALVLIDNVTTGGFYTAKFIEMSGKISDGFSR